MMASITATLQDSRIGHPDSGTFNNERYERKEGYEKTTTLSRYMNESRNGGRSQT